MVGRGGAGPPYSTALCVIAWAASHRSYITGRATLAGYGVGEIDQLDLPEWYAVHEAWFVDAHTGAFWPAARVLEWLREDLPAEWERQFPDPERHGLSERAQAAQRRAEERYGPSG